jgi:hypothetical protein
MLASPRLDQLVERGRIDVYFSSSIDSSART